MTSQSKRPPSVEVHDVHKQFGTVCAVDGVTFRIEPGEVVALLGPNGAGKTTTLDMILGLTRPDRGEIQILGTTPRQALDDGQVGCVLQQGDLLKGLRVHELIRAVSALQPRPAPLAEVVKRAQLDDLLNRKVTKLSGGETQRVRFALALVGDPALLILDEPTAAMDVSARRSFWDSMREFVAADRTVLFSTHYLEEADAIADRIILLAQGRVVADGPASQIRAVAGAKTLRCTLSDAQPEALSKLPGAGPITVHGTQITIRSLDSDRTLRALLDGFPLASDIEVTAAPLADAVLALTDAGSHR
ncbi:ABC transporter ATP-binding protein [Rhizocola hellebori]|uniref:ABC transporter ATP-binding protein n=1 Tax=Rhizocola hellebori TaxID=1392758 RepID=A0A8J3Q8X1_9ACTN|nr:ABC transporter ATP-binding protein [Rhizocola hellebori]GIH05362.1 ABC transporter ATP-binding protein [Rhizocola hellebori]